MSEQEKSSGCPSSGCGAAAKMTETLNRAAMEAVMGKIRHKLLVMSGKGGVGKSSVAVNLAVGLARRGRKTGILDVDLHGPSIATMTGVTGNLDVKENRFAVPKEAACGVRVVSMQSLIREPDQAVIWRGPAKTGVIRQFMTDVDWGELDTLVIDSPPGTGDEPLSVAQFVPEARAVIVTTPQETALSDVRKSIRFCQVVGLDIIGLVENMGPFPCPCCGKTVSLFKSGGGERTATAAGIPFLGTLPFDPAVVAAGDDGNPLAAGDTGGAFSDALTGVIDALLKRLDA